MNKLVLVVLILTGVCFAGNLQDRNAAMLTLTDEYNISCDNIRRSDATFDQKAEARARVKAIYKANLAYVRCDYRCSVKRKVLNDTKGGVEPCECVAPSDGFSSVVGSLHEPKPSKPSGFGSTYQGLNAHQSMGVYMGVTGGMGLVGAVAGIIATAVSSSQSKSWGAGHTCGAIGSGVGIILCSWRITVGVKAYRYDPDKD